VGDIRVAGYETGEKKIKKIKKKKVGVEKTLHHPDLTFPPKINKRRTQAGK
jgi:hypothetical protein